MNAHKLIHTQKAATAAVTVAQAIEQFEIAYRNFNGPENITDKEWDHLSHPYNAARDQLLSVQPSTIGELADLIERISQIEEIEELYEGADGRAMLVTFLERIAVPTLRRLDPPRLLPSRRAAAATSLENHHA